SFKIKEAVMAGGLKRRDLQVVAEEKLADAILPVNNNRFSNAYYLSGYAVEIGLKACIAKEFIAEAIPYKNFVNEIYKHNLKALIGVAGLAASLRTAQDGDPIFAQNWAVVTQWAPEIRYEMVGDV